MVRPHGRYVVDSRSPRAKAICDRCSFTYQLSHLRWQFEWSGPKLQNLRIFVCQNCLDLPQPNLRTFVIPPDPQPVYNPRPERYVLLDGGVIQASTGLTATSSLQQIVGGLSGIGVSANFLTPSYGSRIGSLTGGGGLNAAMDGNANKPSWQSAAGLTSTIDSTYSGYIGINWQENLWPNSAFPSSLQSPAILHTLSSVSMYAPSDRSFIGTSAVTYAIQFSSINSTAYANWTTIATGTTAGTAGERIGVTITSTMTNTASQYHRVAFLGNGTDYPAVAQVTFSVNEVGGFGAT